MAEYNKQNNKKDYKGYINHRKRLKNKYNVSGINSLGDYEILELLLTYSIPRRDVKPIAKELLTKFHRIEEILKAVPYELKSVEGLGEQTGIFLRFIGDLFTNLHEDNLKTSDEIQIRNNRDLINFLRGKIAFQDYESFYVLFLNVKNSLIKSEELFRGTIDRSVVYPRNIIEKIIKYGAKSIIFAHNHPSNNPYPSKQDIDLTKNMQEALKAFDINLIEHIIITKDEYFSFLEEGLL